MNNLDFKNAVEEMKQAVDYLKATGSAKARGWVVSLAWCKSPDNGHLPRDKDLPRDVLMYRVPRALAMCEEQVCACPTVGHLVHTSRASAQNWCPRAPTCSPPSRHPSLGRPAQQSDTDARLVTPSMLQVGAVGFCMGGALAFCAAQHCGVAAAAPFYGTPHPAVCEVRRRTTRRLEPLEF